MRAFGKRYRIPLTRGLKGEDLDSLLRAHPLADTWSALEYACHVRDVFEVQLGRIRRALAEDDFRPESMRRDERVVDDRYNEQDPVTVADAIAANGETLAEAFESFTDTEWERTMTYLYPEKAIRSLEWVAQHTVHEAEHHLLDVGRVMRTARGR